MRTRFKYIVWFISLGFTMYCYGGELLFTAAMHLKSGYNILKTPKVKKLDCPVIVMDNITISSPTCNNNDGSITGITVTASAPKLIYSWYDNNGKIVGNQLDLVKIPPGVYTLQVEDNICDPVNSSPIKVESSNGVTISGTPVITNSSCKDDGSITGLKVIGAIKYQWYCLETGLTYTSENTPDIFNIPPGSYKLTASNATCSSSGNIYFVSTDVEVPVITKYRLIQPTCNNIAGDSIQLFLSRSITAPSIEYYFINEQNKIIGSGTLIAGAPAPFVSIASLPAGTYHFAVAKDNSSCPVIIASYTLKEAKLVIYPDSSQVINDQCNKHNGAIVPYIVGGTKPKPVSKYTWTHIESNTIVGDNKILFKVGAGSYRLDIVDPSGCEASSNFLIGNDLPPLAPPKVEGSTICLPGPVSISVKNADESGLYKLYSSLTDSIPLAVSKSGFFTRNITQTTNFFVAFSQGNCESNRVMVNETVIATINIPNTITPNNDGTNDFWNISGIEKFPGAEIRIFSREGLQIFYSVNNSVKFDGTYKGMLLPMGVYYYTIDVKQSVCFGKISGSITVIR